MQLSWNVIATSPQTGVAIRFPQLRERIPMPVSAMARNDMLSEARYSLKEENYYESN